MGGPQPPKPPYAFYRHAIARMAERGYTVADVDEALSDFGRVVMQSNGRVIFVGRRSGIGVVADQDTGEIVSVLRPGMIPS